MYAETVYLMVKISLCCYSENL